MKEVWQSVGVPQPLITRNLLNSRTRIVGSLASTLFAMTAAIGLSPQEIIASERVDLIEVNHFYDEHGKLVFDQIIFYDWCDQKCRYNVRAWRLLKKPAQVPSRNWEHGDYVSIWKDGALVRHVRAPSFRESWTQYDPELAERDFLPKERRADLCRMIGDGSTIR